MIVRIELENPGFDTLSSRIPTDILHVIRQIKGVAKAELSSDMTDNMKQWQIHINRTFDELLQEKRDELLQEKREPHS